MTNTGAAVPRQARVIGTLTLACAAAGAVAGLVLGGALVVIIHNPFPETNGQLYRLAAQMGALAGAMLGPVVTLTALRHVPLGRLFIGLTTGGIVGGLAGFGLLRFVPVLDGGLTLVVVSAVTGFGAAAMALWRRSLPTRVR